MFDARVFLGESFDGTRQSADELLEVMDSTGIEQALVCPFKSISYNLNKDNENLAVIVKARADRLVIATRIDPWQPDAQEALQKGFEKFGSRALYLNPWEEHFRADARVLDPLMDHAQNLDIPVIIETGYPWLGEALQVGRLAKKFPEVTIVMTNGGQMNISGLGQAGATITLRDCPNVLIDTAGVYRQDFLEETIEAFGCQRVLFGSGSPYYEQRFEIKRIQHLNVDDAVRKAVQEGNAKQLFYNGSR